MKAPKKKEIYRSDVTLQSESVVNEITKTLRGAFSREEIPKIYKDYTVENLKTPCIVVKQVSFTDYPQTYPHHSLRYIMDIRFHPDKHLQMMEEWGRDKAYRALLALQYGLYLFGQKIHFSNTETTVYEGVTHLMLVFSFFVRAYPELETPDMGDLDLNIYLKNEYKYQLY